MLEIALLLVVLLIGGFGAATASLACLVGERRSAGRPISGRSACVCGAPIPLWRNLPVLTWLAQRGRAHCCGAPIPRWYLIAETGTALGTIGGLAIGGGWGALAGVALCSMVVATKTDRSGTRTGA